MSLTRRIGVLVAAALVLSAPAHLLAAASVTFTADDSGTFGGSLTYDRRFRLLTVDLSALPKDAAIFRAELTLNGMGRFQKPTTEPTTVYPVGQPEKKLRLVWPAYRSLDCLDAVKAAVAAGKPLKLMLQVTLSGPGRLEVSYAGPAPDVVRPRFPKVTGLKVAHRKGQSLITFTEPALEPFGEFANGAEVGKFKAALVKKHPRMAFRIWRSSDPITPRTIHKARLVGRCGLMTAWNSGYHQGNTKRAKPVRYRVTDGGDPVEWGTGIYAHNPRRAGRAYYAVTVAIDGQEDFGSLGADNTTSEPVEETVGLGEPILQWIEQPPKGWHYRQGPLTRLIYTRWESWGPPAAEGGGRGPRPHSSTPNNPIDYLVAMGDAPMPDKLPRNAPQRAWRVEPAPVGLHLHCWGASLNGGYGWWHNAHRGAVLIASNQIPYDWWTGYHERSGTSKTFGDGYVRPFTMNRTFGFLEWATTQWKDAPEMVRKHWRKLDLTRVFTAGSSMGGSGAPMFGIRYGGRVAWSLGWVGVHIPAESPQFTGSYRGNYGRRDPKITLADGRTSPWDHFSDVWWLRKNVKAETAFIMASNGKSDGAIGWPQAVKFARALQETRRPHLFNWGPGGHGTRTLIGANFNLDVRTDQTLPAFTNCSLDQDVGTATKRSDEEIAALKARLLEQARAAGKNMERFKPGVSRFDGDDSGSYNGHLWWKTDDVVDQGGAWEMTVILKPGAPKDSCTVDLTPRRLGKFRTPGGRRFKYTVTHLRSQRVAASGQATADEHDLLTLKQIPLVKGDNRVKIVPVR
ncbi:MAG: alpha/beta hydrolase [Planctomycetota bacterium]|jgi:hypothetical protein